MSHPSNSPWCDRSNNSKYLQINLDPLLFPNTCNNYINMKHKIMNNQKIFTFNNLNYQTISWMKSRVFKMNKIRGCS
jgi:hypothetical protein